jgi:signal transduction histidine kinase
VHDEAVSDGLREVEIAGRIASLPKVLDVACKTGGMGFTALSRIVDQRWIACGIRDELQTGVDVGQSIALEHTLCRYVQQDLVPLAISDTTSDTRFHDHPAVRSYGFRTFVSVPIFLPDGTFFGSLSGFHYKPRTVDIDIAVRSFEQLANLIALNLDKELQLDQSRAALAKERRAAELREQFIAVLGHDLRNPLASIQTSTWVLKRDTARASDALGLIQQSVGRMAGLIDDVMDFARGRLGSGIAVKREADVDVLPTIQQVVRELESAQPGCTIISDVQVDELVNCDLGRIAQLLSNLLGNALTHGDPQSPVLLRASVEDRMLTVHVSNRGTPIPDSAMTMLFQPFVRATADTAQQGLGLGLFIASEIAREHDGNLSVESGPKETRFTFRMPVRPHIAQDMSIAGRDLTASATPVNAPTMAAPYWSVAFDNAHVRARLQWSIRPDLVRWMLSEARSFTRRVAQSMQGDPFTKVIFQ